MLRDVATPKTSARRAVLTQIGVRLPPPAVDKIDRIVEIRNEKAGWDEVNRSDIIRELVMSGLEKIEEPQPAKAKR